MKTWTTVVSLGVIAGFAASAVADNDHRHNNRQRVFRAQLVGLNEVPSVSTQARGQFYAIVNKEETALTYWLTFSGLTGATAQAHIHIGQHHVNGGISLWLCQGTVSVPVAAPANVQAETLKCDSAQPIVATLSADDVVGPPAQGITGVTPEEFAEVLAAMRAGAAYANVHSATFAGGEIRGQIN